MRRAAHCLGRMASERREVIAWDGKSRQNCLARVASHERGSTIICVPIRHMCCKR